MSHIANFQLGWLARRGLPTPLRPPVTSKGEQTRAFFANAEILDLWLSIAYFCNIIRFFILSSFRAVAHYLPYPLYFRKNETNSNITHASLFEGLAATDVFSRLEIQQLYSRVE